MTLSPYLTLSALVLLVVPGTVLLLRWRRGNLGKMSRDGLRGAVSMMTLGAGLLFIEAFLRLFSHA